MSSSASSLSPVAPIFIRALIEGVAFDLYSNVRVAEDAGIEFGEIILNGGPTKSTCWNQITADVTGRRLVVPDVDEAARSATRSSRPPAQASTTACGIR